MKQLSQIISVDEEECKNCHACIAACPIKFCIDGSGNAVTINHNLCVGCGKCIVACTHNARGIKDDFQEFQAGLKKKEKFVAIVAPAAAAVFEGKYLQLNTWLKNIGVEAVFDVSFGAELTVKSYLDYIATAKPKIVISQPCPSIVTYIELYRPELLPYLAPADSPMLHTVRMIHHFFQKYAKHRIVAISPCIAKKREFDEMGLDILNVTMHSVKKHLKATGVKLDTLKKLDYDNPPAERAVLFSTPGGLLNTAEREAPHIASVTRKIEGTYLIYNYLDTLPETIKQGRNPLLVDCLNCEEGCNGGTGTGVGIDTKHRSVDDMEYFISLRSTEMKIKYRQNKKGIQVVAGKKKLDKTLAMYWKKNIYNRKYQNLSENYNISIPSRIEKTEIYKKMLKYSDADIINCCSCGYNSCEMMATAIFNGLNRAENCSLYREKTIRKEREYLEKNSHTLNDKLLQVNTNIGEISTSVEHFLSIADKRAHFLSDSTAALEEMVVTIQNLADTTERRKGVVANIALKATDSEIYLQKTLVAMHNVASSVTGISEITAIIKSIASNTNLLSLNASIEAAHAGDAGKSFAVVADEIGKLADISAVNVNKIGHILDIINKQVIESTTISQKTTSVVKSMLAEIDDVTSVMSEILLQMNEMKVGSSALTDAVVGFKELAESVGTESNIISKNISGIQKSVTEISTISNENLAKIDTLMHNPH